MKRISMMGLSLVAAFALSALVAGGALAAKHVNTGPLHFTSTSGIAFLEVEPEGKIECKVSHTVGEETSATGGTVTATFEGCETLGKKCNSAGQGVGTIVTKLLAEEVGYVNKAKAEIGTDFKPASGEFNAEFGCPGSPALSIRVKGSVIGKLTPANVSSTEAKSTLQKAVGKQEIEKFEGGPKDTLISETSVEGGPFSAAGGIQNVTSTVVSSPQIAKKGKKTVEYADPSEAKTGGATPVFGRCRASKKKGKFSDANCTVEEPAGDPDGNWEFFPVPS
jgi:hypothetical protein